MAVAADIDRATDSTWDDWIAEQTRPTSPRRAPWDTTTTGSGCWCSSPADAGPGCHAAPCSSTACPVTTS